MSAIVAIPARLKSTRFPRKVLADIQGKPMLWHVYQGVSKAESIDGIYVLTDSQEILDAATSWGATALMTSEECPSGTARIAEVLDQLDGDIVVNVQADEPLITGAVVDAVIGALENSKAEVATPVYRLTSMEDVNDPNLVKVVRSANGLALYFSRSPIPYLRDREPNESLLNSTFWGHAGIYAYRRNAIRDYMQLPESQLEEAEKLEQLRLLEAGKQILTVEIDYRPYGVDVPADLEVVKEILAARSCCR